MNTNQAMELLRALEERREKAKACPSSSDFSEGVLEGRAQAFDEAIDLLRVAIQESL